MMRLLADLSDTELLSKLDKENLYSYLKRGANSITLFGYYGFEFPIKKRISISKVYSML